MPDSGINVTVTQGNTNICSHTYGFNLAMAPELPAMDPMFWPCKQDAIAREEFPSVWLFALV